MYLIDTNVISELRKKTANSNVVAWGKEVSSATLYVSVISILELEMGVLQKERHDPMQGAILRTWLNAHVLPAFSERILHIDVAVAQRCAKLHIPNPKSDRDALIAATALVHGMTLVTRNTKDFVDTEVELFNPWEGA